MKKSVKKILAVFLSLLMLVTALPLSAVPALAATTTLSSDRHGVVVTAGNSRFENGRMNIVNDGEDGNTDAGILHFNIGSLNASTVANARISVCADEISSLNDSSVGVSLWYTTSTSPSTYANGSQTYNSSWGGGNGAITTYLNNLGVNTKMGLLGTVQRNTSRQEIDITNQIKAARNAGSSNFYVIFMMNKADATGSNGGWSDSWYRITDQYITYETGSVTKAMVEARINAIPNAGYIGNASGAADGSYSKTTLAGGDEMANVLWAYGVGSSSNWLSRGDSNWWNGGVQYGDATLLYTGSAATMGFPVNLFHQRTSSGANSGYDMRPMSYAIKPGTGSATYLEFRRNWHGPASSTGYVSSTSNSVNITDAWGDASSAHLNSKNEQHYYSNTLYIKQNSLSASSFSDHYTQLSVQHYTIRTYDGNKITQNGNFMSDITFNSVIRILDYSKVASRVSAIRSLYNNTVKGHESEYCTDKLQRYYDAVYAALADPNSVFDASSVLGNNYGACAVLIANAENSLTTATTEPQKHTFNAGDVLVSATCTTTGTKRLTCTNTNCGETKTEEIPATGHNFSGDYVWVNSEAHARKCVNAGCNTVGLDGIAGKTEPCAFTVVSEIADDHDSHLLSCANNCGNTKREAHSYDSGVENPVASCIAGGTMVYTCQTLGCGHIKSEATEKSGHKLTMVEAKDATCTEDGNNRYYICSVCEDAFRDIGGIIATTVENEKIDALGHTMMQTPARQATCTEVGTLGYYTCSTCKKVFEDEDGNTETTVEARKQEPLNHIYANNVFSRVPDTETHAPKCDRCGELKLSEAAECQATVKTATCQQKAVCDACAEEFGSLAQHEYVNYVIKEGDAASCTGNATETGTCKYGCGATDRRTVPDSKLPHTIPADWSKVVEPNCGTDGYKVKYCTECGAECEREIIPTQGSHNMVYAEGSRVESTCVTNGSEKWVCSYNCGFEEIRTLELNPDNHESSEQIIIDKKDADCGNDGYSGDLCHACCKTVITPGTILPKTNAHTWMETERKEASCIADGYVHKECSVCHQTTTEILPLAPSAHGENIEVRGAVAASCTDAGMSGETWCLDCGNMISGNSVVPPTGHQRGETNTLIYATCTEKGLQEIICSVCGLVYATEDIPAAGHTAVKIPAIPVTCITPGRTAGEICEVCGVVLVESNEIPATGHKRGDWHTEIEADCGSEGLMTVCCLNCDEILEAIIIPANGQHHYSITESGESTCATHGYNLYECYGCGSQIVEELPLDYEKHEGPETLVRNKDTSCAADGYTGDLICAACELILVKGEVIPATGVHVYDDGVFIRNATEGQNGIKRFTCLTCDDYYDEEITWSPHTHNGGQNNANCTTRARCAECGAPYGDYNNMNHTALVPVDAVAATCTTAGHGAGIYCEACRKYVNEPGAIPALGHTDEDKDNVCDTCGTKIPVVINKDNFRCTMCDAYDLNKDKPMIGWFYRFIHAIVHFFQSLTI